MSQDAKISVEEGNKLIAEFMTDGSERKSQKSFWIHIPNKELKHWVNDRDLKYHSSWDWLMPVVEKISRIEYKDWGPCEPFQNCAYPRTFGMLDSEGNPMVRINGNILFTAKTLIEATWEAVIDFLQWYQSHSEGDKQK